MTLAKYCYHYLKDKLVICSFIGPSFHQAIISHALWCHQSLSLLLSMANPIELEDEDQHLNLGGCLRSKQAISILIVVVVKDTVSMVLEISYLQVVSLSVDLQSNVFIGAMADLIPQVLVWIPWTYSCKSISSRMLFHQDRFYLLQCMMCLSDDANPKRSLDGSNY
ncbi:hypothetical protein O0I10_003603 [Lichtheimia ornata]|uniref:Uncharacterized protein n=1 Tax=Lichtheimia ornata TaxID=688661 RepID=A0AAD7V8U6_9FUNG|nr:uncharacterized protein O0I10_003603 [Lichtheimia ornata]KAJ8660556.1 hypothetical protein O0I10_003603 [Lichtheimia ornata]